MWQNFNSFFSGQKFKGVAQFCGYSVKLLDNLMESDCFSFWQVKELLLFSTEKELFSGENLLTQSLDSE